MLKFDLRGRRGRWNLEARAQLDGGCVGLFGPSGAGKSSLLEMLGGLLPPERGMIELNGVTLFDRAGGTNVAPHRRDIAIVFQDNLLFPHYSVEGNLRYGEKHHAQNAKHIGFDDVVGLLQLDPMLDRSPGMLSGGERRRVAIGRALLASPNLLLLDEPLTGLDAGLRSEILAFLDRVRDALKIPMIYVSHHLEDILQLTRELWFMHEGRLLGRGDYLDLVQDSEIVAHLLPMGLLNVLEMEVSGREPGAGCTTFRPRTRKTDSQANAETLLLHGPLIDEAPGAEVSLTLRPEDVALSPEPVNLISVRNQIRGRIRRHTESGGRALLEVDIGLPLLVEISSGSYERLGLAEDREVWCLIKATALKAAGAPGSATD